MVPLWAPCKSHGLKLALSALSLGLPLRRMGPVTDFWEESLRDLGRWGGGGHFWEPRTLCDLGQITSLGSVPLL